MVGIGSTLPLMLRSAEKLKEEGIAPTVADLRFIKPLDLAGLSELISGHTLLVVAEENYLSGGTGEAIANFAAEKGTGCRVLRAGVPDRYISHATRSEQLAECGLTPEAIVALIRSS